MLFGTTTEAYRDAAALMDACAERGAAFFDAAEMYPVPQCAATAGRSEQWLGAWMAGRPRCVPPGGR